VEKRNEFGFSCRGEDFTHDVAENIDGSIGFSGRSGLGGTKVEETGCTRSSLGNR
jgi:hypothetical protein